MMRPNNLDHVALHEQVRFMGGRCPICRARPTGCPCGGTCASCRQGANAYEDVGDDMFEDVADDMFEDAADEAFEDLAQEGVLGALGGIARIGAGVGRLGAGLGRIASGARAVTAPLRTLGRIGAGAQRLAPLGRLGAGAGRLAAQARSLRSLAGIPGRIPGRAALGRLPGRAALGRIPGRAALGRLPGRAALGRIPGRAALGRLPGRAALGRIAGQALPARLRALARQQLSPARLRALARQQLTPGRLRALARQQLSPARLRALARQQLRRQMRAAATGGPGGLPPDTPPGPPPAPGPTPAQTGGPFGEFQGWGDPVSLQTLLTDRRTAAGRALPPEIVQQFFRPGRNLYRITVNTPSGPQTQYLNIGMTGKNIATRVREHYAGTGDLSLAERKLHDIMHAPGVDPSQISVQAANLPDHIPPRVAHMFEIWLQHRERVSDWPDIQDTRTFEEDDEEANEAYTDLQMAG